MDHQDIFSAIIAGDLARVEHLVSSGVDLQIQDHEGLIPICRTIRNGEVSIASLLRKHAGPFDPPLYWKAFQVLLKRESVLLSTLLYFSAWYWLYKLCEPLWKFDSHLRQSHPFLFAVYICVRHRLLVKTYENVYRSFYPYQEKQTPVRISKTTLRIDKTGLTDTAVDILEEVLRYGGNMESFMLELLDSGFPIGDTHRLDGPAACIWIWAAEKGYLRVLQQLAKTKIDVNMIPPSVDCMALGYAVSNEHLDCVRYLLKPGANSQENHISA